MDIHDLGAGRGTLKEVLGSISALSLSIGISSDVLYPADEQKEIAHLIPRSSYVELTSPFGHDAFLIAFDAMNAILQQFLGTLPRVPAA
jgi:homoserine O-acetyltransferase